MNKIRESITKHGPIWIVCSFVGSSIIMLIPRFLPKQYQEIGLIVGGIILLSVVVLMTILAIIEMRIINKKLEDIKKEHAELLDEYKKNFK